MKKNLLSLFLLLSIGLAFQSCSDDKEENKPEPINIEKPGEIPGFGSTSGEPTGTTFNLPNNLTIKGKIIGGYEPESGLKDKTTSKIKHLSLAKSLISLNQKSTQLTEIKGSGYYVNLYMVLKNTNSTNTEIIFPEGLIAKSLSGNSQNGVLLKKVKTIIPANSEKAIMLVMYCGNAHKAASSYSEEYKFTVITNSTLILNLCNKLKNKKINIEEYDLPELNSFLNDPSYQWEYFSLSYIFTPELSDNIDNIQYLLWKLTDTGETFNDYDNEIINNLPNSL